MHAGQCGFLHGMTSLEAVPLDESLTLRQRVYRFAPLDHFRFGERWAIRLVGVVAYYGIALFGRTIRWEVHGWKNFEQARAAGRGIIFTFWHNRIFLATWFWRRRGIVVMTSRSFDGEYIARFIQRFGYGAARGSASRGAGRALVLMINCLRNGIDTAFTIDGPRGPRYVAKRGAILLAQKTDGLILPFHISSQHYWEARSWDGFQVPKPFTRAAVLIGEPLSVANDGSPEELNAAQQKLQAVLNQLRQKGDGLWPSR